MLLSGAAEHGKKHNAALARIIATPATSSSGQVAGVSAIALRHSGTYLHPEQDSFSGVFQKLRESGFVTTKWEMSL